MKFVTSIRVWLWAVFAVTFIVPQASPSAASISDPVTGTNTVKTSPSTGKIALRLLYAGHPGSAREREFVEFLGQHFQEVKTGDWSRFNGSQATGFDVVILDYDGDGFKVPQLSLSPTYTRPTMTLSVAGGLLCGRLQLKPGYM